jgi:hypothetical protein
MQKSSEIHADQEELDFLLRLWSIGKETSFRMRCAARSAAKQASKHAKKKLGFSRRARGIHRGAKRKKKATIPIETIPIEN